MNWSLLRPMVDRTLFQISGLLICGTVFAWLSVHVLHGIQQLRAGQRQYRVNQLLIRRQISTALAVSQHPTGWDGLRKFRVKWKVRESNGCHSLFLVPHDEKPLPPFQPGQYLTLHVRLPGKLQRFIRCYSLSDAPRDDYYRLTVKKVVYADGREGAVSSYLNDCIREGDILDVASPKGPFRLDPNSEQAIVLLAGGIGATPLISMLNAVVTTRAPRMVYFFYGVRNGREHTFKESLQDVARQCPEIKFCTCYSNPNTEDVIGKDFDVKGRVTIDLVKDRLPSNNFDFYLCGPASFTTALIEGLKAWKVPDNAVHYELFGPAKPRTSATRTIADSPAVSVEFTRSSQTLTWTSKCASLLEFADANGIAIESGCRSGSCGTCVTAIREGRVRHTTELGTELEDGTCLACIAVPDGPVKIDA